MMGAKMKSTNVYNNEKWGVHIIGPDSILAADSFNQAFLQCNKFNSFIHSYYANNALGDEYPIMFANIFIWNEEKHGSHEPERTDWDNVC